jgi:uncharacterized membrane protein YdjX (TVP38/TMEM64 family)
VRRTLAALGLAALAGGALYSYSSGGVIWAVAHAAPDRDGGLDAVRRHVAAWGPLGPLAYVLLVIVEVLVAPIPGALLYAPGGAIFGGLLGGALSLAGNVAGAVIACAIAGLWRDALARRLTSPAGRALTARLRAKGLWVIFLLRLNPLTSSDLVSYAAGLVGVPLWKVAVGTLAGMTPLCFAQAYFADRLFQLLPGAGWLVVLMGMACLATVIVLVGRLGRPGP